METGSIVAWFVVLLFMEVEMTGERKHEFVIRCDGEPSKLMVLPPEILTKFTQRLRQRYPDHEWAIADRFLPQGAD